MVDIIKCLPPVPTAFSSNLHRVQYRRSSDQITLPIFLSTVNNVDQSDRTAATNNTKRWIGRCPGDPPRQLNISDAPDSTHRKVMYSEFARYFPATTADTSASSKIKQQQKNSDRDSRNLGTTVTSLPSLSGVDAQNFRLFDTLSKHVTIKAEPLRSTNNFINNSTNTLTSWQKYWLSTQTQRRRKEAIDSESIFHRPKLNQPLAPTTRFITVRDSSFFTSSETNTDSRTASSVPSEVSSPTISEKQPSLIREEEEENHFYSPELSSSPRYKTPPMNPLIAIEEKPASPIKIDRLIIKRDAEIQDQINTITTKIYKLPLPSNQPKVKKPVSKRGSRSKSLEKQPVIPPTTTSVPKRSRQMPSNQTSSNKPHRLSKKKQQSLSSVMNTTPRSKYEKVKWDEPYVGVRFDPPTPPCSPSLFVWP